MLSSSTSTCNGDMFVTVREGLRYKVDGQVRSWLYDYISTSWSLRYVLFKSKDGGVVVFVSIGVSEEEVVLNGILKVQYKELMNCLVGRLYITLYRQSWVCILNVDYPSKYLSS